MVSKEYVVNENDTLRGAKAGSTLRASEAFQGRAIVVLRSRSRVENLTIEGSGRKPRLPIAPYDRAFVDFYPENGIVAAGGQDITIRNVTMRNIANYAVLISAFQHVTVDRVRITDSGSLNDKGRNNTSGGILLEEGTSDFTVSNCTLRRIAGNGIWTHSRETRNARGRITGNRFEEIGRDAIQVGHATEVRVDFNTGTRIGYPPEIVDVEGGGTPVAVDTAGNVDHSVYAQNDFTEINGKCFDLDGFHDGEVMENVCRNQRPATEYRFGHFGIVLNNTNRQMQSSGIRIEGNNIEGMKFGGLFLIGSGHTVRANRFLKLNRAGCNESHAKFGCIYNTKEPEILQSGIYLGAGAERPDIARDNTIRENIITGFKMAERCIGYSPAVDPKSNTVKDNVCQNQ